MMHTSVNCSHRLDVQSEVGSGQNCFPRRLMQLAKVLVLGLPGPPGLPLSNRVAWPIWRMRCVLASMSTILIWQRIRGGIFHRPLRHFLAPLGLSFLNLLIEPPAAVNVSATVYRDACFIIHCRPSFR